jgi:hypothetical protein
MYGEELAMERVGNDKATATKESADSISYPC